MELRQYLGLVWKWLWLVILAVVIAASASYLASKAATPLYRTSTTMMVGQITQDPNPTGYDIYTSQQLATAYTQLVRREPVLKSVIENLGLEMSWQALAGQVSAYVIPQTQLLEIGVVDSDPYRAKVLADAIAQQLITLSPGNPNKTDQEQGAFIQSQLDDLQLKIEEAQDEMDQLNAQRESANSARQIQDLENRISLLLTRVGEWQSTYASLLLSLQGGEINKLSVLEEATIPTFPFSPNTKMNVATAAAIGAVLAVAGAFLIEYLDDTIKDPDDVERTTGLPTLGAIARIGGGDYPDKLLAAKKPLSPVVEAYRVLRTNLQFSSVDKPAQTLLMTSPGPSEGKSVTLANLAVVMAQSGQQVIIVDTDLRRPVQHRIFDRPNRYGLSDVFRDGKSTLTDRIQSTGIDNLRLLSSGKLPPNPSELLGSERMKAIIEELENEADIILFDSPPTLVVADAAILGSEVDGVLIVNDAGRTRSNEARRAANELRRVHVNLLGVVLNRLSSRSGSYYYYYYYYYYEDGEKKPRRHRRGWLGRIFPRFRQTPSEETQ